MQTELRVINLGARGGKVVRRFFKETRPAYSLTPVAIRNAYLLGYITRHEAYDRQLKLGYRPAEAELYLLVIDLAYKRNRKEVKHD